MVTDVGKHEEIIAGLRLVGLDAPADRLSYLEYLADDDPDEPSNTAGVTATLDPFPGK